MRILLTSNASYAPPRGGSTRSNLVWLRQLASAGHECRVVCAALEASDDVVEQDGFAVMRVHDLARRSGVLRHEIARFSPDWLLVTSEDLSHMLLREAHSAAPDRLVYIAHTPQFFPFGQESWNPDPQAAAIVQSARAVVVISQHMADYVRRETGVDPQLIHPPIYGEPPWPNHAKFDSGYVLMINPSAVKGIDIFISLAQRFPAVPFAALAGWATTTDDRKRLAAVPNITTLESVGDIDEVLAQSRLLLMPSVWLEGFGLIAMEAMLRSLPCLSSTPVGAAWVLPVQPVARYLPAFDEAHMPRPVVPDQDIEPWAAALQQLLSDRDLYARESARSREAALQFVGSLRADDFERMLRELAPAMRVLLAHNSLYYPSHGGGDVSNRLLMEALAARGHTVRVMSRVEKFGAEAHSKLVQELSARGIAATETNGAVQFRLGGVVVETVTRDPRFRARFSETIAWFNPDVIITSTDDPAQLLLEPALRAPRAKIVHLVRATIAVPFGPDSSSPSTERTEALRKADALVGVSEYVARYIREQSGIEAVHVPISLMPGSDAPLLGRFENPYIALVNPCAVKGIDIFLELAARMPSARFAAVPTWGTTAADMAALKRHSNIEVLRPVDNIDELMRQTKVLLVPSVWAEARSRVVVEAMARGVPVVASDTGGIPEAKLGVPYVLPVRTIERYRPALDENMVPIPEVPPQDVAPWQTAVERLVTDEAHWRDISRQSREAALAYIGSLCVEPFERLLRTTLSAKRKAGSESTRWSPERHRLLAIRLRRRIADRWFPGVDRAAGKLRLFCFPHAGAGALFYRDWEIPGAAVCPVLLPGRETRANEAPLEDMDAAAVLIAREMEAHLNGAFAFFGHSMGAALAFEVARRISRKPVALIASAAKAPQFRLGWTPPPEPGDEELIDQLRALGAVAGDEESLSVALPAIKADARLYRNYVYSPAEPFDFPICAYGGESDAGVRQEHLQAWAEQTTAAFKLRIFPGGHFYLRQAPDDFLTALAADLQPPQERS